MREKRDGDAGGGERDKSAVTKAPQPQRCTKVTKHWLNAVLMVGKCGPTSKQHWFNVVLPGFARDKSKNFLQTPPPPADVRAASGE